MLAINGCNVIGVDYFPRAAKAAQLVKEAVQGLIPAITDRLTICAAGFPELTLGVGTPGRDRVLIFTNVGASWDQARLERVIRGFATYHYVILCLRLFGSVREEPEAWDALAKEIAGIVPVASITPLMPDSQFRTAPLWVVLKINNAKASILSTSASAARAQ